MGALRKNRRQCLDEAISLARGAVKALEVGARMKDAALLELAASELEQAGRAAGRLAVCLSEAGNEESRDELSPMRDRRPSPE